MTSCASLVGPAKHLQHERRRRARASGASDDCFACTKKNTKCDRKRPYCSQCLEVGKECSGYKTQLTWGVGVASRGKLRGLSLPVAKSSPAPRSPPATRQRASSTRLRSLKLIEEGKTKLESMRPMPSNPFMTYDFVNMDPNGVALPIQMLEWNLAVSQDYSLHGYHQGPMNHPLGRGDGLGISSSIVSSINQLFPNDESMHRPVPMCNSYSSRNSGVDSPVLGMMQDASRGPTSCPDHFSAPIRDELEHKFSPSHVRHRRR
jgi:hypothetical protein